MELNRRNLLIGTAAGGGLLLAWTLLPRRYAPPLAPGKDANGLPFTTLGYAYVGVNIDEVGLGMAAALLGSWALLRLGHWWSHAACLIGLLLSYLIWNWRCLSVILAYFGWRTGTPG